MDIKIRNIIIFGIFLVILLGLNFTGAFGQGLLYSQEKNEATAFDGLVFDQPANVKDLRITRGTEGDKRGHVIKYDVSFSYEGGPSDLRILNSPVRTIFFQEGVQPSLSKATLKGDYEEINRSLQENLKLADHYKKLDSFGFLAQSQIRLPLKEEVGDYTFTVYTKPRDFIYGRDKRLAEIAVFLTNARVEKFTDDLGLDKASGLEAASKTEKIAGSYVNSLELMDKASLSKISTWTKIARVLFIGGLILVLATIWLNQVKLRGLTSLGFGLVLLTLYPAIGSGVSSLGSMVIMPIMAFIGHLMVRLFPRKKLALEGKDFKQALALGLVFFFVATFVYIVPRGL
ncbi:MAG: hypothetical protein Q4E37_01505 [Tissierellia bacterium]|nr:hypothetical protein [Tissierellia bacterium]